MNADHQLWGFERLEAAFGASGGGAPALVVDSILQSARAFMGATPPHS